MNPVNTLKTADSTQMILFISLFGFLTSKEIEPDSDGTYRIRYNHTRDFFDWMILGDWGGWPAPIYTRRRIFLT